VDFMQQTHITDRTATRSDPTGFAPTRPAFQPDARAVAGAIANRSFATLATVSPAGHPHVAGVLYEQVGSDLYISTLRSSRKARNIAANGRVGVCVPIRRLPVGPPSSVQFQGCAEVLDVDDPAVTALVGSGSLGSITGHGELEIPDGCFIRVVIPRRLLTYGLGMSLRSLIRDPLAAGGVIDPDADS
jgi:hypothetical protein